jgi:hypothetical protein
VTAGPTCSRVPSRRCGATSLLALLTAVQVSAAVPTGERLAFVTCPIFRETDLGCQLVRYKGELFFVGSAPPFMPEQGHKVLIEAIVADGPLMCGGRALQELRVSVFPEIDDDCRERLRADGWKTPMPPPEVLFPLIDKLGQPIEIPTGPYHQRVFTVPFMFGSVYMGQGFNSPEAIVETAALYATASKARHVTVRVSSGVVLLDGGEYLQEEPGVAVARAEAIRKALVAFDVPVERIEVKVLDPGTARGDVAPQSRTRDVQIVIDP